MTKTYSDVGKFGVVHFPHRHFPGVVVQGDTLHGLFDLCDQILSYMKSRDYEKALDKTEWLKDELEGALQTYEIVCSERGLKLPYDRKK